MNAPTSEPLSDPVGLVASLSGDDIRRRLAELEAEQRALMVLLRSVAARERAVERQRKAVAHAG